MTWNDEYEAIIAKIGRPSNPVTKEWLEEAYKNGMIKMADLKDGATYYGDCRNTSKARWNAKDGRFYYTRTKFGQSFEESIECCENDQGTDVFIPVQEIL